MPPAPPKDPGCSCKAVHSWGGWLESPVSWVEVLVGGEQRLLLVTGQWLALGWLFVTLGWQLTFSQFLFSVPENSQAAKISETQMSELFPRSQLASPCTARSPQQPTWPDPDNFKSAPLCATLGSAASTLSLCPLPVSFFLSDPSHRANPSMFNLNYPTV